LEWDGKGWVWEVREEHIENYGTIYGQIEILAGDELVWESYIFPIEVERKLGPSPKPGHGCNDRYLREIERQLQQKASMDDLEAYMSVWEPMK